MEWFRKAKSGIGTFIKRDTPVDLWVKCEGCKEILYRKELAANKYVCEHCGYHFRIGANDYVKLLIDEGTWQVMDPGLKSTDPLKFTAKKKYKDSLHDAEKNTGAHSGVVAGVGEIKGIKVSLGVMDFRFIGGSMGSVEAVSRWRNRSDWRRSRSCTIRRSPGSTRSRSPAARSSRSTIRCAGRS